MGKDINKYKLIVFIIGAFFAGVAGSLYALSITFMTMRLYACGIGHGAFNGCFGGMGNTGGAFIGALVLIIFPEMLLRF